MKKNRSVVTAGCKNAVTINRSVVTVGSKSAVTINRYCQTTKFCSLMLNHNVDIALLKDSHFITLEQIRMSGESDQLYHELLKLVETGFPNTKSELVASLVWLVRLIQLVPPEFLVYSPMHPKDTDCCWKIESPCPVLMKLANVADCSGTS